MKGTTTVHVDARVVIPQAAYFQAPELVEESLVAWADEHGFQLAGASVGIIGMTREDDETVDL